VYVGFRPAFEVLSNDALPVDITDGDVVVIGTLYMDGKPVRVPEYPIWDGDIEEYIPDAKLELRAALDDPAYQVKGIKAGDVFICDCCLLENISYDDIEFALSESSSTTINWNELKTEYLDSCEDIHLDYSSFPAIGEGFSSTSEGKGCPKQIRFFERGLCCFLP